MKTASIVFLKIGGFLESICNYPEGNWVLWPQLCELYLKNIFCSREKRFGFKINFHHIFLFFIFYIFFILLPCFLLLCSMQFFCIFCLCFFFSLELKSKILISSHYVSWPIGSHFIEVIHGLRSWVKVEGLISVWVLQEVLSLISVAFKCCHGKYLHGHLLRNWHNFDIMIRWIGCKKILPSTDASTCALSELRVSLHFCVRLCHEFPLSWGVFVCFVYFSLQ